MVILIHTEGKPCIYKMKESHVSTKQIAKPRVLRYYGFMEICTLKTKSVQPTVAELRDIKTRNDCTTTLVFCDKANPCIRRQSAELLLRSIEKRSEAT